MNATTNIITKRLPQFSLARCKRCGICIHFCALQALAAGGDGVPYLAHPETCNSCGLCRDMCPDWAICLEPIPLEAQEDESTADSSSADPERER
jgi:2-oxoglutarate ferredoxin oxidoreductase subunit delta